jgi:hypothetical protein
MGADGATSPSPGVFVLSNCLHPAPDGATESKTILFENHPSNAGDIQCFRAMLRVLIALGLNVQTGDKYTVIVPNLPAPSAANLEGLSRAATAKLVVERRADGAYAVCSSAPASAFSLGAEAFDTDISNAAAGGFFDSPNMATTSLVTNLPQSCSEAATAKPGDAASGRPAFVFRFTTRSLDSMLYYLGEDVRADGAVTIWTGHGERMKEMPLFLVERGGGDALVSTDYRGSHYGIPDQCGEDMSCEQQHRSLQVLSLLNQIWGLQKEATEAPSVPVVSVINSR